MLNPEERRSEQRANDLKKGPNETSECPIERVLDIRRIESVHDEIFSEDEENQDKQSTQESDTQNNTLNLNLNKGSQKKFKDEYGLSVNSTKLFDESESIYDKIGRILDQVEFQVLVKPQIPPGFDEPEVDAVGNSIWVDDLKDFLEGMI